MVLVMIWEALLVGLGEFFGGSLRAEWGPQYHRDVERWVSMVLVTINNYLGPRKCILEESFLSI